MLMVTPLSAKILAAKIGNTAFLAPSTTVPEDVYRHRTSSYPLNNLQKLSIHLLYYQLNVLI